jgi:glycosyltransferase involved in cell wall biosynthesis
MQIFIFLISLLIFSPLSAGPQKTIALFGYEDARVKPWDPETVKTGIVGSEEAMIYMSEQLAKLGYKVIVFAYPPQDSPHSLPEANPRWVKASYNDGEVYDIAVAWRLPWQGPELKKRAKKVYLWVHDTYQGNVTDDQANSFDDVLWLSEWQREHWSEAQPAFAKFKKIFGNGINLDQFHPLQEKANPHSCIYGSNYARGLEILLDIWPEVKKEFPKATLDIYYGWNHWGLLSPEKEIKMRMQLIQLKALDVIDHGFIGHEQLNRAYERASLWTYPCIAPETFCITALRAQLSGAIPVIIEGSALKETVRHGFKCTSVSEYLATLKKALKASETTTLEDRKKMGDFIKKEFTWNVMAKKWADLFEERSQESGSRSQEPLRVTQTHVN